MVFLFGNVRQNARRHLVTDGFTQHMAPHLTQLAINIFQRICRTLYICRIQIDQDIPRIVHIPGLVASPLLLQIENGEAFAPN